MRVLESTMDTSVQAQRVGTVAACTARRARSDKAHMSQGPASRKYHVPASGYLFSACWRSHSAGE